MKCGIFCIVGEENGKYKVKIYENEPETDKNTIQPSDELEQLFPEITKLKAEEKQLFKELDSVDKPKRSRIKPSENSDDLFGASMEEIKFEPYVVASYDQGDIAESERDYKLEESDTDEFIQVLEEKVFKGLDPDNLPTEKPGERWMKDAIIQGQIYKLYLEMGASGNPDWKDQFVTSVRKNTNFMESLEDPFYDYISTDYDMYTFGWEDFQSSLDEIFKEAKVNIFEVDLSTNREEVYEFVTIDSAEDFLKVFERQLDTGSYDPSIYVYDRQDGSFIVKINSRSYFLNPAPPKFNDDDLVYINGDKTKLGTVLENELDADNGYSYNVEYPVPEDEVYNGLDSGWFTADQLTLAKKAPKGKK